MESLGMGAFGQAIERRAPDDRQPRLRQQTVESAGASSKRLPHGRDPGSVFHGPAADRQGRAADAPGPEMGLQRCCKARRAQGIAQPEPRQTEELAEGAQDDEAGM